MKTIKITCSSDRTLPLAELTEFQGDLKYRDKTDIEKVIKSILKHGFSFPFFVWQNGKHNFILDGHGRKLALKKMWADGYEIPELPVIYINAENEADAKEKLLRINSRFGDITSDSLADFAKDLKFDFNDVDIRVDEALKVFEPVQFKKAEEKSEKGNDVYVPMFARAEVTEEQIKKNEEQLEQKFAQTVEKRKESMVNVYCKHCGQHMLLPKDFIIQKIAEMRGE